MQAFEFLAVLFSTLICILQSFFSLSQNLFYPTRLRDVQTRSEHALLWHERCVVVGIRLSQKTMEKHRGWSVCDGFKVLSMPVKTKPWTLFSVAVSTDQGVKESAVSALSCLLCLFASHCISICCTPA